MEEVYRRASSDFQPLKNINMQVFRVTRSEENLWTVGIGNPDGGPWEPLEDFNTRQEAKDWIINKVSTAQRTQTLEKMLDRYGEMIEQLEVQLGKLQNQVDSLEYREAWPTHEQLASEDPWEDAAAKIITDLIQDLPENDKQQVSNYLQTLEPCSPIEENPWNDILDLEEVLAKSEIAQAAADIEKGLYQVVEPGDIKLGLNAKIQELPHEIYKGGNRYGYYAEILGINKINYGLLTAKHIAALPTIEAGLNKILDSLIQEGLDQKQQLIGMSIYFSVATNEQQDRYKHTVYYAGQTAVVYTNDSGEPLDSK